eukprot:Opistho-1_new@75001
MLALRAVKLRCWCAILSRSTTTVAGGTTDALKTAGSLHCEEVEGDKFVDEKQVRAVLRTALPSMPADFKLDEADLREQFVRGGGKGGQCVNRLANCVMLKHLPTGLDVREHSSRSLAKNRESARARLLEKVAHALFGAPRKQDIIDAKDRKRGADAKRKARLKAEAIARNPHLTKPALPAK